RFSPNGKFSRGVTAVAFIRDDYIKSMNWNVQLLSIIIYGFVADVKDRVAPEQIDRHSLDCADVDKSISLLGVDKIRLWQSLGIKLLGFVEVFALETLAIDFVNLVELQP